MTVQAGVLQRLTLDTIKYIGLNRYAVFRSTKF